MTVGLIGVLVASVGSSSTVNMTADGVGPRSPWDGAVTSTRLPDQRELTAVRNVFVRNEGQADPRVAYYLDVPDATLMFRTAGLTVSVPVGATETRFDFDEQFVDAARVEPVGMDRLHGVVSYFAGSRRDWHAGVSTFGRIRYRELWPGIDASYVGTEAGYEARYTVRPHADPSRIRIRYKGAFVSIGRRGELRTVTPGRTVIEKRPIAYQLLHGVQRCVAVAFRIATASGAGRVVRFRLGSYDHRLPLVIDPLVYVYAGFVGGPGSDQSFRVAVDAHGDAYITGLTTAGISLGPPRGHTRANKGCEDAFVAKVDASGTGYDYVAYLAGAGCKEAGLALAVDRTGAVYIGGATNSDPSTFPVTVGPELSYRGSTDGFAAKLSPDGTTLVYCGYVGGSEFDEVLRVGIDSTGALYLAGKTASNQSSLPVTVGPSLVYGGGSFDGFVGKVAPDGSRFDYLGFVGGAGYDLAWGISIDTMGAAYLTGATSSDQSTFPASNSFDTTYDGGAFDAYVAQVLPDGTGLAFAGYLGGVGDDYGRWIAVGSDGSMYVTGYTTSDETTFPMVRGPELTYGGGEHDAFVTKIAPGAAAIAYSGYLGGAADDLGRAVAVAPDGSLFVVGETNSSDFPIVGGPQLQWAGSMDGWVAHVSAGGTRIRQSTYVGGTGRDLTTGVARDAWGGIYITGETSSADFPMTTGPGLTYNGGSFDAYIAKLVIA